MPHIIAWCGFLGAWLLVAGPLDQAVREVEESEFEREAVTAAASQVEPPQVSGWWLLLPPVWWVLRQRRVSEYWHRVSEAMDDSDLVALLNFKDVFSAWAYVAAGASLIAVKETWELHEAYGWPESVFFALLILMLVGCIGATSLRYRHRKNRPAIEG
jgi:hypothetical protein